MNLGILLSKAAATYSERIALAYGPNSETYSQLDARVNSLANGLLQMGIRKGDSVAILQYNSPPLLETLYACFKAGFVAVPMNARLHESEVSFICEHSEASAIIFSPEFKETVRSVPNAGGKMRLISLDGSGGEFIPYDKVSGSADEPKSEVTLNDVAWLFYTSGTTGRPKGAMLTHRNLLSMTTNFLADVHAASTEDIALHVAPLTHGSGLYALPMLARGSTNLILLSRSFDPVKILDAIVEQRVTVLPFLTPTMIKMLLISPTWTVGTLAPFGASSTEAHRCTSRTSSRRSAVSATCSSRSTARARRP